MTLIRGIIKKQPPEVFYKTKVLKNFAKFTGKHLCQSFFFVIKLQAWGQTYVTFYFEVFFANISKDFRNGFRTIFC